MENQNSLEETPTWAVSIVCLFIFLISFIIETFLHRLTLFFKRRKKKSLKRAMVKIKTEMMIMGFISLLLTISEASLSKICVSEAVANSFLPCKDSYYDQFNELAVPSTSQSSDSESNLTIFFIDDGEFYCQEKGKVSLFSGNGLMQLKILISVLAVFHVLYCLLTMFLGMAKMRKWKKWEEETRTLDYQIANDPRRFQFIRQTPSGRRHLSVWSSHPLLLWAVCFIRQFSSSASKSDYFALRNAFIAENINQGSDFNFQLFVSRANDDDFQQVVSIKFWIWIFSLLFIFFSAHRFYYYYWLPFIPLLIILVVGTKLQVIITKMYKKSSENSTVIRGTLLMRPGDDWFWFGRPKLLLHLLQLVLIQNSFQLAFFAWSWYEFGLRSCFHHETVEIAIRIAMGVGVQLLCGYFTLPLYALVTQMGSGMRRAVFSELVVRGLKSWQEKARASLSQAKSSPLVPIGASASNEIEDETLQCESSGVEEASAKSIAGGISYDGEASFGSSWKKSGRKNIGIGEISCIVEEDDFNLGTGLDEQNDGN